jgi:PAS domain S-box-containing protein
VEDIDRTGDADIASSAAERRLAAIVQSSDDAIYSVDADGLIEDWNPGAERLYGFLTEEIVGNHVSITAPPERRGEVADNIRRAMAGEHIRDETVRLAKDGRLIDVSLTISPIHDREGQVIGMSTIARDITDRKSADERERGLSRDLEEARDTLELVTMGAADGITIQDANGGLVYANLAAARLSGYGSVEDFMAADPRERLAHWEMLNEDGEPFPIDELPGRRVLGGVPEAEAVLRVRDRRDGHEFWSLVKATATFDAKGHVRYAINLFRDISGQKEAERSAHRKAAQMSHLYDITAALSGTTDIAMIAEALAEQTLTAFEAARGAVVLRSEDDQTLETVAWRGHDPGVIERWRSFPLDDSTPIGDAVLRNVPIVMGSPEEWLARYPGLARAQIPAAAASIPLDIGDRAIGGITLSFDEPRGFTPEDVGFMLGAARQGAQALERGRSEEIRRLAEARLALLARAGGLLAESIDYPKTLTAVVDLVVPRLADWASVEILEPDGVRSVAVAHVDPEKVAMAQELRRQRPPDLSSPTGIGHVIATGRTEVVPEITEEMIAAIDDPEVENLVRELQLRSALIVPLSARGRTLGAMTLVWAESGRTYSSADLALAETLAARIALVIDNARLYRDRDHIARTLQQSLLPPEPASIPGVDLAARYRPAGEGIEVGGDFYDAFEIGGEEWTVALGDAVGKGPDAAALMGMVRHTIRAAAIRERAPARVLATVNSAVARQTTEEQFCTAVAARVRPLDNQVIVWISVAGHPSPVILRADGSLQWIRAAGALLGVFEDAELAEDEIRLAAGDTLILYTDGVTEERGDAERTFGEEGLAAVLREAAGATAEDIVDRIERAVLAHGSGEPKDDIAILAVRATGGDA